MNKVEDVYKYVRGVYECKEFSSYQDLIDNTEIVLRENENEDNKFYLIQTEYGNLGFTYYHLGTKPSIILKNYILFMGFGTSIVVKDILQDSIISLRYGLHRYILPVEPPQVHVQRIGNQFQFIGFRIVLS